MSKLVKKQQSITTELIQVSENRYTFTVAPLEPGNGHTIGNALRRILLSSIPGYAVTRVSINDTVTHEYQPVDGVVEDALDILLNVKNLHVTLKNNEEKSTLHLKKKGPGAVYAKDFTLPAGVTISNPDLYICTLDKSGTLDLEVDVELGFGYLPLERVDLTSNPDPRKLLVDALFSPITNVALKVEDVRVGDMTNYNKVTIDFTTNGTIDGKTVIDIALQKNIDVLQHIKNLFDSTEVSNTETVHNHADMEIPADTIDIKPKKIVSILEKHGITTNAELRSRQAEISEVPGLDEKMIDAIEKYIAKLDK